jgi:hypothetical protein
LPPFIIVSTATAEEGSSACLGLLVLIIGEGNWVLGRNEIWGRRRSYHGTSTLLGRGAGRLSEESAVVGPNPNPLLVGRIRHGLPLEARRAFGWLSMTAGPGPTGSCPFYLFE